MNKLTVLLCATMLLLAPLPAISKDKKDVGNGTIRIYDNKFDRQLTIRDNRIYEGSGFKQKGWIIGDKVYGTKFERKGYLKK